MIKTAGQEAVWTTPNMEISHLSKRWRSERNLWMTAFAFCAWVRPPSPCSRRPAAITGAVQLARRRPEPAVQPAAAPP